MTEYTTDSHLNANCIRIAEEIEAHANGRAYTDENGDVVILDSDDEPTDEMEYRGLYDFINDAFDVEITRRSLRRLPRGKALHDSRRPHHLY